MKTLWMGQRSITRHYAHTIIHSNQPFCEVGGWRKNWETQRKPTWTWGEHVQCHTDSNPSSGVNWEPMSCAAATPWPSRRWNPWGKKENDSYQCTEANIYNLTVQSRVYWLEVGTQAWLYAYLQRWCLTLHDGSSNELKHKGANKSGRTFTTYEWKQWGRIANSVEMLKLKCVYSPAS